MAMFATLVKVRGIILMWNEDFFLEASLMFLLLVCFGYLSLVWVSKWVLGHKKTKKFPPGPLPLPIIGHLHLLTGIPHQALAKLSSKYGGLMGLNLGQQRCVVVSSPEVAKEFLVKHDKAFANRPPYGFTSCLFYGQQNDLFFASYGAPWRRRRKICTLRLFTAKRLQEVEYVRYELVGALLHKISRLSHDGTVAVDISECVGDMSTNLISRLLYSHERESERDQGGTDVPQLVKDLEQETVPFIGDFIPWISWLDLWRRPRIRYVHRHMDAFITRILTERKEAMMHNNAPTDDLLHEIMKPSQDEDHSLTMLEVKSIILGMLGGSIHTTALTLEWAMAELLKNPHCLTKLQREIDTVIGCKKKQISDSDIPSLKYLRCVVKEVFRLHPVAPLLLPRISTEECKVHDYTLPANTHLLVNVWAIGRDEGVWKNARNFIPERFEGKDIDLKGQHFELLPFGAGRRICMGLPLALSMVEVTLANLVNKFDWELPNGVTCETMNMNEKAGISSNKAAPTIAVPRHRV
ncbi:hypothetical protein GOP47_0015506 [Adiantum capillus-veneris]|uniref:Cytochrome P450 n=1 Tax=Adiantum capillus-veneris TaxID=13818 RepID=A0A9D4ZD95_ADICA|nr:hypothetical protein GOP47_0015506 [Adiantum capillus-veneris]